MNIYLEKDSEPRVRFREGGRGRGKREVLRWADEERGNNKGGCWLEGPHTITRKQPGAKIHGRRSEVGERERERVRTKTAVHINSCFW